MIDQNSSKPMYSQLKDILEEQILKNVLKNDSKLPSQKELSDQYNVSLITVRKALEILENHKLVYTVRGKGTYVRSSKIHNELVKITSFGKTLQLSGMSGYTRILSYEPSTYSPKMDTMMESDLYGGICCLKLLGFGDDNPVVYYHSYLRRELGEEMYKHAKALEKSRQPFSTFDLYDRAGVLIGRIDQSIKAVNAGEEMSAILKVKKGKALLVLETMVYDNEGIPLEHKVAHYISDKYLFKLKRER